MLGFILGQGSMFLVQSWLLYKGLFNVLAYTGIGLGILTLIQWTADMGGTFILSRYTERNELDNKLIPFFFARLLFSIFIYSTLYLVLLLVNFDTIVVDIIYAGILIPILWAFNITGILDNKKMNSVTGPLSGISWMLASLAIITSIAFQLEEIGIIVGLAYSIGIVITLIIQYFTIKKANLNFTIEYHDLFKKTIKEFIHGGYYSLGYISAQAYARSLPILIEKYIDVKTAGMFLYAKSFVNILSQLIYFIRRVEFSNVVKKCINNTKQNILVTILDQKLTKIAIIIILFLSIILTFTAHIISDENISKTLTIMSILILLIILWTISSSIGQIIIAEGKTGQYAFVITLSSLFCFLLILNNIRDIGINAIYIYEALMYLLQIMIYLYIHYRKNIYSGMV